MCVTSIALGGQWEGVEARGGARLFPATFPDPPHPPQPKHISLNKKSLDFVWPVTSEHHCTFHEIYLTDNSSKFGVKLGVIEIRRIFPIKLRNFTLKKWPKLINFMFPEG